MTIPNQSEHHTGSITLLATANKGTAEPSAPNLEDNLYNKVRWFSNELFIGLGGLVIWLIYLLNVNRNLLYLTFVLGLYICGLVLVQKPTGRFILLASVIVFLCAFRSEISPPPYILAWSTEADSNGLVTVPQGEIWQYQFIFTNLEHHEEQCGPLEKNVVISGQDLHGLQVEINNMVVHNPIYSDYNALKKMNIKLENNQNITVNLEPKSNAAPKIFQGAEAFQFPAYRDAVFVEMENNQCRVLYHAPRKTIPLVIKQSFEIDNREK